MSDCGGDDGGGGCDFDYSHDDVNTSHDHSIHSASHAHNDRTQLSDRHHSSSKSNALPTYEDAVGADRHHHRASLHKVTTNHDRHSSSADVMVYDDNRSRNNKDKTRNGDYQQHPQHEMSNHTSLDFYDREQSIFDPPSRSVDRRNQAKKSAWAALKARKSAGSEQRSTGMSGCTICLMIFFVLIVIAIVLVWTLLKW